MNNQAFPTAAKSLIETSRSTLVNVINAGRKATQQSLKSYDKLFKAGTDTIAQAPIAITGELRDTLVSLESQLSLLSSVLVQGVATQTTDVANRLAGAATGAADNFEQVFELRVMQALDHLGVPVGVVVRELADRVASLAREFEQLIKVVQIMPTAPVVARKAPSAAKSRSVKLRRSAKRRVKAAA